MPKLIVEMPGSPSETFELDDDSASIGRLAENTIQVEVPQCSRRHAQILRVARGFEITDLKSSNGTMINGAKKERHLLKSGDVIGIGEVRITFRDEDQESAEEDLGGVCGVVYASGAMKGKQVPIAGGRITFGRSERNKIVLADQMVSSYHCEITKEGDGYILRDLGSTNGSVVNGEPVSETTLAHGARVRLGKTLFIFVDPAVADYQKALAAQEEKAEAEWGMMRAQVDMARVKKARRAALVWVAVFVVLLGGAAAVFTLKPELAKSVLGMESGAGSIETNRLNRFKKDFSFENGTLGWRLPEGQQATARLTSGPNNAHQGSAALAVGAGKGAWPPVSVRIGEPQEVSKGNAYEISGWLRPRAGSHASVGVLWSVATQEARLMSLSPWVGPGSWGETRRVVSPPENADQAQFVVVIAGDDAAGTSIDDVDFHPVDGTPDRPGNLLLVDSGNFGVQVNDQGATAMLRGRGYRLWGGGFLGVTEEGDVVTQELCFRPESVENTDGGVRVGGTLLTPGGESVPLTVAITSGAQSVKISLTLDRAAPGLVNWGIGFRISREYLRTIRDQSKSAAGKLFFGQQSETRELLSVRGLEPSTYKSFRQGSSIIALLGPAGAGTRTYELDTRLDQMRREAEQVLARANSFRTGANFGGALEAYEKILKDYPFDDLRERALTESEKIVKSGEKRQADLTARFETAGAFSDVDDLVNTRSAIEKLAAEFPGHEISTQAADVVKRLNDRLKEIQNTRQGGTATQLKRRAEDFQKARMPRLARAFEEEAKKYGE